MPLLFKVIFSVLAAALTIATGVALSKMAHDTMLEKPSGEFVYAVDSFNKGGLATFAAQIVQSKEVTIATREVSSGILLEAIKASHLSGARVRVLLDGTVNSDPSVGALGYLRKFGIDTRVTKEEMFNQFLVLNRRAVFSTTAPWTPAASKQEGLVQLVVWDGAGIKVTRMFDEAWGKARKL